MKQTAVEWLEQEIFRKYKFTLQQLNCQALEESIQQAKEMEKQQQGYSVEEVLNIIDNYNETFKVDLILREDFNQWFEQFKKK